MNQYRRAWGDLRQPLQQAIEESPSTTLILHMPKTGGSTLFYAVRRAAEDRPRSGVTPSLRLLTLPLSSISPDCCECGLTSGCIDHSFRSKFTSHDVVPSRNLPLVVKFNHESYKAVDWVRKEVGMRAAPFPVVLVVRPRRDRLRSMFRDYWTQVAIASGSHSEEKSLSPHRQRVLAGYADDAVHYRDANGSIDGVAWFRSFRRHGPGVVFYLDEVFGGDTKRLKRELTSGALKVIPTKDLDFFVEQFTNRPAPTRRREALRGDPAVEAALDDASDLIEDLALRDAAFDRVIAESLGDPEFFVE